MLKISSTPGTVSVFIHPVTFAIRVSHRVQCVSSANNVVCLLSVVYFLCFFVFFLLKLQQNCSVPYWHIPPLMCQFPSLCEKWMIVYRSWEHLLDSVCVPNGSCISRVCVCAWGARVLPCQCRWSLSGEARSTPSARCLRRTQSWTWSSPLRPWLGCCQRDRNCSDSSSKVRGGSAFSRVGHLVKIIVVQHAGKV